jgi:hypothetical protein
MMAKPNESSGGGRELLPMSTFNVNPDRFSELSLENAERSSSIDLRQ